MEAFAQGLLGAALEEGVGERPEIGVLPGTARRAAADLDRDVLRHRARTRVVDRRRGGGLGAGERDQDHLLEVDQQDPGGGDQAHPTSAQDVH